MNGLVEFLTAGIAEDEAVANLLVGTPLGDLPASELWVTEGDPDYPAIAITAERVLAECESKRRIVEMHRPEAFEDEPSKSFCTHDQRTAGVWPCETIRLIALPYADRPGFREEWRA